MRHLKVLASSLAVVLLLVMATDYVAIAATGKPVILGKLNTAGKTTIIKSSKGPALKLVTKPGKPPLAVKRGVLVKKLNADKVDGKSASQLGLNADVHLFNFSGTALTEQEFIVEDVPAGTYMFNHNTWLYTADNVRSWCQTNLVTDDEYFGFSGSDSETSGYLQLNGTGFATLEETQDVRLYCEFEPATDVSTYTNGRFVITPVNTVTGDPLPRTTTRRAAPAS
jgi:hypothetical protein